MPSLVCPLCGAAATCSGPVPNSPAQGYYPPYDPLTSSPPEPYPYPKGVGGPQAWYMCTCLNPGHGSKWLIPFAEFITLGT
jgi:hypothetical protein